MNNKDISVLELSKRSDNSLRKFDITTVNEMIRLTESDLRKIRELGTNSINEILEKISLIKAKGLILNSQETVFPLHCDKTILEYFFGSNAKKEYLTLKSNSGLIVNNIRIEELEFSPRLKHALQKLNIKSFHELILLPVKEFISIPALGNKSISELYLFIKDKVNYIEHETRVNDNVSDVKRVVSNLLKKYSELRKTYSVENIEQQLVLNISDEHPLMHNEMTIRKTVIFSKIFLFFLGKILLEYIKGLPIPTESKIEEFCTVNHYDLYYANVIHYLIEEKLLSNKHGLFMPNRKTFQECITLQNNDKRKDIVSSRAHGKTLEKIAQEYSITRERVRQLEKKAFTKLTTSVYEDIFKSFIEYFSWSFESLKYILDLEDYSAYYLLYTYKTGEADIDSFIESEEIPTYFRKRAESYKYRDCININGQMVLNSRRYLLKYAISTFAKNTIEEDIFIQKYKELLTIYNLSEKEYSYPDSRFHNISTSNNAVSSFGRSFRAFDVCGFDINELFKRIDFEKYQNQEISVALFFTYYPEVMEEYDIQNEYEFHNIIKKRKAEIPYKLEILKMPNIIIGTANRDEQVKNLLKQESPIGIDDFISLYSETYGVKKATIAANYLTSINKYLNKGVFSIDVIKMNDVEYSFLKSVLTDEIYSISEIREIYAKQFTAKNLERINTYNLKVLGFNINSTVAYLNKYSNFEIFINHYIEDNTIIDFSNKKRDILKNVSCYNRINESLKDLEIIEFERYKYLNSKKLREADITKQELQAFSTEVTTFARNHFFTIKSIENKGFEHKLFDLGFNSIFYQSILYADKKLKRLRLNGQILFKEAEVNLTVVDFLYEILENFKVIDIFELIAFITNTYGILFEKHKLQAFIEDSELYYDKITEKIYIDYDTYLEEV